MVLVCMGNYSRCWCHGRDPSRLRRRYSGLGYGGLVLVPFLAGCYKSGGDFLVWKVSSLHIGCGKDTLLGIGSQPRIKPEPKDLPTSILQEAVTLKFSFSNTFNEKKRKSWPLKQPGDAAAKPQ